MMVFVDTKASFHLIGGRKNAMVYGERGSSSPSPYSRELCHFDPDGVLRTSKHSFPQK
jgi:hypothetical protein